MNLLRTGGLLVCLLLLGVPLEEARADQGHGGGVEEAVAAMEEQRWGQAIRLLDAVIQKHPAHLEAHYLRGICYGERGKHPTVQSRLGDFLGKGQEDFQFILDRDSLYRDVLYQYALVRRYDNDYQEAIALTQAQIRLKPEPGQA